MEKGTVAVAVEEVDMEVEETMELDMEVVEVEDMEVELVVQE